MPTDSILIECEKTINEEFVEKSGSYSPALFTGLGGAALFYAYFYIITKEKRYLENCLKILGEIVSTIEDEQIPLTFCDGLAGIGWLIQHLGEIEVINAKEYNIEDFDKYIGDYAILELSKGNYDFLHGGIGAGIYLISRPLTRSAKYLENIVNALYKTAIIEDKGIFWLDRRSILYDNDKRPRVNLGLAHGMPSIVYFLSKVLEIGILENKVEYLLRGVIDFVKSNRMEGEGSIFPNFYYLDNSNSGESRLAWCYGDLSVISSFFVASKVLDDSILLSETKKDALFSSDRIEMHNTRLSDGALCHGYAGVSLIFKKFYDFSNEARFIEISEYWYHKLISEIKKTGGPQNFSKHILSEKRFEKSYDFLSGLTGAAFVIMMFNNNHIDGFEKCLLLS